MREDNKTQQPEQGFSLSADERPSRQRASAGAPRNIGHGVPVKSGGGGYWVSTILFLLLVAVAGGGYWQFSQLQKTLADTRQQLQETRESLGQVTGEVSKTGENISQSDSVFRSELKVLNSEIRKLWDVTNKRNRQWITENKEKIAQTAKKADQAVSQMDGVKKSYAQQDKRLVEVNQMIKAVTTEQLVANSDMTAYVDALKGEIAALKKTINSQKTVEQQVVASAETQEELSKKLSSFQSQVSVRLQQLENSIRAIGDDETGLIIK
ncbi:hypothetical protein [uncultured Endozoicomonas sp.]|uniref:hypothetical protein n=1 Tax=uncultured Endozoicomonas sp. TaxID=432652 RepID=UPI00262F41E4|nr:hypothetical protein [uncultured Endozoicomonas sp.]